MIKKKGEWGKIEEMFLSYPPEFDSLGMLMVYKDDIHFIYSLFPPKTLGEKGL